MVCFHVDGNGLV